MPTDCSEVADPARSNTPRTPTRREEGKNLTPARGSRELTRGYPFNGEVNAVLAIDSTNFRLRCRAGSSCREQRRWATGPRTDSAPCRQLQERAHRFECRSKDHQDTERRCRAHESRCGAIVVCARPPCHRRRTAPRLGRQPIMRVTLTPPPPDVVLWASPVGPTACPRSLRMDLQGGGKGEWLPPDRGVGVAANDSRSPRGPRASPLRASRRARGDRPLNC